jgi:predicted protein tyrosine phosphatase
MELDQRTGILGSIRVSRSVKRFQSCITDVEVVIDIVDTYKVMKPSVIVLGSRDFARFALTI